MLLAFIKLTMISFDVLLGNTNSIQRLKYIKKNISKPCKSLIGILFTNYNFKVPVHKTRCAQ